MERFGGRVKRHVTNRTRPILALTNQVLKEEMVRAAEELPGSQVRS